MNGYSILEALGIEESDQGYYRQPTVCGERVVFVSEDDLWEVPLSGGFARRLTAARGEAVHPHFSPDGRRIAFTSTEEGAPEVYVMDSRGGRAKKLTFNGAMSTVVGWSPDGAQVLYRSNVREPFERTFVLYGVDADGGEAQRLELGPAHTVSFEPGGPGRVLARNTDDLARWKRYRGGTAGVLWIDAEGDGQWRRLLPEITAGLCRPMWIGGRIYFVSDYEGYGNLYSCRPDGQDLRRHTDHVGFYVRFPATDGTTIVYTCGGDLYRFDVASEVGEKIAVDYASPRAGLARKFVEAEPYLDDFALHPRGHSLAVTARGKLFNFGNWEGAVRQSGVEQGVRYRLVRYLGDGERLVAVSDEGGEERLELHRTDGARRARVLELEDAEGRPFDIGRPVELLVSPTDDALVITNHRHELVHVDLERATARVLDRSEFARITGVAFAPDGRWVAYGCHTGHATSTIRIAALESGEVFDVTTGEFQDVNPYFDPAGRYLYFLSYRHFDPVYDQMFFELSFPRGMKPCVVTLRDDVASPFLLEPRPLDGDDDDHDDDDGKDGDGKDDDGKDDAGKTDAGKTDGGRDGADRAKKDGERDGVEPVVIEFANIASRVEVFPVPDASYGEIAATEERVFWTVFPVEGSLGRGPSSDDEANGTLESFSFESQRKKTFARGVSTFEIGPDGKTMVLWTSNGLQVVSARGEGPGAGGDDGGDDDEPSRQSGYIDLGRIAIAVEPREEWAQMLRESWRLMREHFWRADMGGVDWDGVWHRYKTLIGRVLTRSEFSDVVWGMQGELGTSHAYEFGGDYKVPPQYRPGFLGAEVRWDPDWTPPAAAPSDDTSSDDASSDDTSNDDTSSDDAPDDSITPLREHERGAYRITRIIRGDSWNRHETSPLARPGVRVREGDVIVAINGQPVSEHVSVEQRLVNQAGKEVEIVFASDAAPDTNDGQTSDGQTNDGQPGDAQAADEPYRTYTVRTLASETAARYREWVLENRRRVHEASDGRLGYVHIPDMGPQGYAEFHRHYFSESQRSGLVVDVRYNGGGHVSQLILEKLGRKQLGYDIQRWGRPTPYPQESVAGPLVCLTNEQAGSDGDVFSHCFKLMKLGPLVGTRTWGGVVGIWPRHAHVDGSITTQPEFSFWLRDVGFGLENYGTEPDIEVELPPGTDEDPQLERAIALALELLEHQKPGLPDFAPYPVLRPPGQLR